MLAFSLRLLLNSKSLPSLPAPPEAGNESPYLIFPPENLNAETSHFLSIKSFRVSTLLFLAQMSMHLLFLAFIILSRTLPTSSSAPLLFNSTSKHSSRTRNVWAPSALLLVHAFKMGVSPCLFRFPRPLPPSTRSLLVNAHPANAAACSGVSPLTVCDLQSLVRSFFVHFARISLTQSFAPVSHARWRQLPPSTSHREGFAPFSNKNFTTVGRALQHA
mmetsp:Transcript_26776/g.50745  ORF Transcript_26776/g.50745 Transcript_26776/m.50745 type:complete len:218 (+) Transcript_26776:660-1313(+)